MSYRSIFLVTILLLALMNSARADSDESYGVVRRINSLDSQLVSLLRQHLEAGDKSSSQDPEREIKEKVWSLLRDETDPVVPARVARIADVYALSYYEDVSIYHFYDAVWFVCISKIVNIGGDKAVKAIRELQLHGHYDGAKALGLQEALDYLESKKARLKGPSAIE